MTYWRQKRFEDKKRISPKRRGDETQRVAEVLLKPQSNRQIWEEVMNRIAGIATLLTVAVLSLSGAASAQFNDQKVTATIPFEFLVGQTTLPAGHYVFLRTGVNHLSVRNAEGNGFATVVIGSVNASKVPANSKLRFETINGTHVLTQVWNEQQAIGSEIYYARSSGEGVRHQAVHGITAGRR
jgi:hypothetical protein